MVRNEDFFALRWGVANFTREHVVVNGGHAWVGGYAIGSEGYIPAADYFSKGAGTTGRSDSKAGSTSHAIAANAAAAPPAARWSFERQWLFYAVWGQPLYFGAPTDAAALVAADAALANLFVTRYGADASPYADKLLQGHALAGRMPLRFASFVYSTWDYTLKSEFFAKPVNNPDKGSKKTDAGGSQGFASVETLLQLPTLDPSLQTIPAYCTEGEGTKTSPVMLAAQLIADGDAALNLISDAPPLLLDDVRDIATWARLSRYFGLKLLGTVALQMHRNTNGSAEPAVLPWQTYAVANLTRAQAEWKLVVGLTGEHLRVEILMDDMKGFLNRSSRDSGGSPGQTADGNTNEPTGATIGWAKFNAMVQRDIDIARQVPSPGPPPPGSCVAACAKDCAGQEGKGDTCKACVKLHKDDFKAAGCWSGRGENAFIRKFCAT